MSDSDLTKKTNFNQKPNSGSTQNVKDKVAGAGAEISQRAGDAMRASADTARDKVKDAADAAKDVASGAAEKLDEQAREKQRSSADFIERFAGNIREASRAFENDAPFAARGITSAAEYVEDAAENATDFAKRQPAAFLGMSVLAGFAAVRFLKASGSGGASSSSRHDANQTSSSQRPDAWSAAPSAAIKQGSARPGYSWEQTSPSQRGSVS
jgi:gas vesicle protein